MATRTRVGVDPDGLLRAIRGSEEAADHLRSAARRVAARAAITMAAETAADSLLLRADRLAAAGMCLSTVHGRIELLPSVPCLPTGLFRDLSWRRRWAHWSRRQARRIRRVAMGVPDAQLLAYFARQPISPSGIGPRLAMLGVYNPRWGDLLDPVGGIRRMVESVRSPVHPPLLMQMTRMFADHVEYQRSVMRVFRRQHRDIERRYLRWAGYEVGDVPYRPTGNRVVALSGIGSSWNGDNRHPPMGLDFAELGYDPAQDVTYFSYAEQGRAFDKRDSTGDLARAAMHLDRQMRVLKQHHPDRAVDVYAHSQGGVVALYWLTHFYNPRDASYPRVDRVITLASPLQGTPNADGDAVYDSHPTTERAVRSAIRAITGEDLPRNGAPSSADMRTDARVVRALAARPVPAGVRVHALAARGDIVVPANQAALPGTRPRVVSTPNPLTAHSDIVQAPETIDEIKRAISGQPERWRGLGTELRDITASHAVTTGERVFYAASTVAPLA